MDETKVTAEKPEKADFKEPFSYRKLFISTFLISAFTVGGGFVLIPLMKAKFVDEYGWLKENEALDLVSIAQSAISNGRFSGKRYCAAGDDPSAADHPDHHFVFL